MNNLIKTESGIFISCSTFILPKDFPLEPVLYKQANSPVNKVPYLGLQHPIAIQRSVSTRIQADNLIPQTKGMVIIYQLGGLVEIRAKSHFIVRPSRLTIIIRRKPRLLLKIPDDRGCRVSWTMMAEVARWGTPAVRIAWVGVCCLLSAVSWIALVDVCSERGRAEGGGWGGGGGASLDESCPAHVFQKFWVEV